VRAAPSIPGAGLPDLCLPCILDAGLTCPPPSIRGAGLRD